MQTAKCFEGDESEAAHVSGEGAAGIAELASASLGGQPGKKSIVSPVGAYIKTGQLPVAKVRGSTSSMGTIRESAESIPASPVANRHKSTRVCAPSHTQAHGHTDTWALRYMVTQIQGQCCVREEGWCRRVVGLVGR